MDLPIINIVCSVKFGTIPICLCPIKEGLICNFWPICFNDKLLFGHFLLISDFWAKMFLPISDFWGKILLISDFRGISLRPS